MALSQRLDLRQTQALVMTPQLQQAIKLLQLSNVELNTFIERELEQNPLLERDEADPENRDGIPIDRDAAPQPGPSSQTMALGDSEPKLAGDDVDAWRDAAGSDGQGDVDLAGDPETRGAGGGSEGGFEFPFEEGAARGATLREHLLGQL